MGNFLQWHWCHCKLRKCVDKQLCANVQSFVTKQPVLSQNETPTKHHFWLLIFFAKFDLYKTAFQSLFSQIIRIWKLFFRSAESYVSCKLLRLQRKTAFPFSRNEFILIIGPSLVIKAGFSQTHGNKERISNRTLVLMWHIFQQSEIKNELLFRHIFETSIHIQTHIRKSFILALARNDFL